MSLWPFEWLWIREEESSVRDGGGEGEGRKAWGVGGWAVVKGPVFCILSAGVVWERRPV